MIARGGRRNKESAVRNHVILLLVLATSIATASADDGSSGRGDRRDEDQQRDQPRLHESLLLLAGCPERLPGAGRTGGTIISAGLAANIYR